MSKQMRISVPPYLQAISRKLGQSFEFKRFPSVSTVTRAAARALDPSRTTHAVSNHTTARPQDAYTGMKEAREGKETAVAKTA